MNDDGAHEKTTERIVPPHRISTDRILKVGTFEASVRRLMGRPDDLILSADVLESLDDASAILQAARAEADRIREEARQEGLANALRQSVGLLEQAEALRRRSVQRMQQDVLTLAVATAGKLIGRALQTEPQLMVELVERSMDELTKSRRVVIRVAPEHAGEIESARRRLAERSGDAALTIVADPALSTGDCIIDTEVGRIDARLQVQFETIMKALASTETT